MMIPMMSLALTDVAIERNSLAVLEEIRKAALASPWTPGASEIVDIIDNGVRHD